MPQNHSWYFDDFLSKEHSTELFGLMSSGLQKIEKAEKSDIKK